MTLRAFTAGVTGVNGNDRNPRQSSLVFNKCPQLEKRPRMQNSPLLAPNRYPGRDAFEVLNGNPAPSAFSGCNDLLGDTVIGVGRETILAPTEFPKFATTTPRAFGLEFAAKSALPVAHVLDTTPRVVATVRVRSNIRYSEIDAKPIIHHTKRRLLDVAGDCQVPLRSMVDQIRFPLSGRQQSLLALSSHEGDGLPTPQRPNANSAFLEAQDTIVIGDRPGLGEGSLPLLVQLVGISYFSKYTDSELGAKPEHFSACVIQGFGESEVLKHLSPPCFLTQPIGALVTTVKGGQQSEALIRVGEQFDFCCNLQYLNSVS